MSASPLNDAERTPPLYPGISEKWGKRFNRLSLLLITGGFVGACCAYLVNVYANWLWFEQVGYLTTIARILLYQLAAFGVAFLVAGSVLLANISAALRLGIGPAVRSLPAGFLRLVFVCLRAFIFIAIFGSAIILALNAAGNWQLFVLLLNREPFGVSDPIFQQDVSFYLTFFELARFLQNWLLALVIISLLVSAIVYAFLFLLRGVNFALTPRMLRHLAILGAILMLIIASYHGVSVFGLVLSEGGVVTGATYTDVRVRLPIYWFLAAIALLSAIGFGVSARYAGLRLMAGSFTLWLLMFLLAGILYPLAYQRLQVAPSEFAKEEPYIRYNIAATRAAYGLNLVEESSYPVAESLSPAAAREHRDTMAGIRLWDSQPLRDAYNQLQFMELYYNFPNMDSDRYVVDGQLRQVLVAARELDLSELPENAGRWVNRKLQYTHGYGVAMSPATGFTPGEGRPEFFIQDIPLQGKLPVARPEVYYGEAPAEFVIVNSSIREVNPDAAYGNYDGSGGVPLSSPFRRFLYSLYFMDINVLLSGQVTAASRLQFRRQVQERVQRIAPFLKVDRDPYPALDDAGRLWWIQDAYTVTRRYPYAAQSGDGFNYMRNSVKAVVDAYNGDVTLYVVDPEDALLRMYRNAFPDLFTEMEELPPDLQRHIRYPVTLFAVQSRMYLRYHVTDPQVFFNQAEQWDVPLETRFGKTGVGVTPTYLVMRLPGEAAAEFVLVMPFSPAGQKKNLVGWLAARNDPPNYGQLKSYHLPDERQIDGPSQVEARIENDQQVSQQFTLWDGSGSRIIRGQLLVIPIADTIVYVEPLYLQSEVLAFPELKKVILADNTNLVMADSMAEGLARLAGGAAAARPDPRPAAGGPAERAEQFEQLAEIEAKIKDLEEGLESLEESLQNLRKTLRGAGP